MIGDRCQLVIWVDQRAMARASWLISDEHEVGGETCGVFDSEFGRLDPVDTRYGLFRVPSSASPQRVTSSLDRMPITTQLGGNVVDRPAKAADLDGRPPRRSRCQQRPPGRDGWISLHERPGLT